MRTTHARPPARDQGDGADGGDGAAIWLSVAALVTAVAALGVAVLSRRRTGATA